ncbi:MAG TPA: DinB family protein [Terriglobales bacterium]
MNLSVQALSQLERILELVPKRLESIAGGSEHRPAAGKWSPKEELGHLLDSAVNNHQRLVRVQMEDRLAMPGYRQEFWVKVSRYQERDWKELAAIWKGMNRQLLAAAQSVPQSAWANTCTVGDSAPMTLEFVFTDYLAHLLHHLQHMGIKVDDLG